jgi:hypothetical protein
MQATSPASSPTIPVSFWILPCTADQRWLQGVVDDLARRHGGPVFEPHVTIHSGHCPRDVDLEGLLGTLAAGCPPLDLAALGTAESDVYYRTLFIEMAADERDGGRLLGLRRSLILGLFEQCDGYAAAAGTRPSPRNAEEREQALSPAGYRPHVSLLYGNLAQPQRAALARQNDFRRRGIVFDGIAAVRPRPGRTDLSQVDHWEVFGRHRLGG